MYATVLAKAESFFIYGHGKSALESDCNMNGNTIAVTYIEMWFVGNKRGGN